MNKPIKGTIAIAISSALLVTNSYSYGNNAVIQQTSQEARQLYLGTEQQQWNAYAASQYTYYDAELLAKYWGKATILDAKYKIGSLLISRNNAAIQQALQQARQPHVSTEQQQWNAYTNSGYTYYDAEILANYWGKATAWDAKLKIGSLLLNGRKSQVRTALRRARQSND